MKYQPIDELAKDIQFKIAALDESVEFAYRLLDTRSANLDALLDAIPPCPAHGKGCIPHALEWIEQQKAKA